MNLWSKCESAYPPAITFRDVRRGMHYAFKFLAQSRESDRPLPGQACVHGGAKKAREDVEPCRLSHSGKLCRTLLIHVYLISPSTVLRLSKKINTPVLPQSQLQATSSCCMFASPITIAAQLSSDVYIGYELTNTSVGGTQPVAQRHGALVVQRRLVEI